jgi:radical SAM superfamily enzyme YgiQ (UPF0313 family)
LKKEGYITKIIDAEIEGKNYNDVLSSVNSFKPDIIGFTCTTPLFSMAYTMAEKIKRETGIPIIIGGPHVTVAPKDIVKPQGPFDYAICGEGEKPMLELVRTLVDGKKDFHKIAGLIYKENSDKIVTIPKSPPTQDINEIPWPDREALMLDGYTWSVPGKGIERFTTLMTDRGCPFSCTFCSAHTVFGKKMRYRDVSDVVEEIDYLVNKLKITHISLIDDTLTLNRNRVKEMCREIIKRKIVFTWEGWTRANTIDEELVKIMKDAGFVRVSFGIESGSPKILKIIKKGINLDDIVKGYNIMKKMGIETRGSVMLGHPYETKKTAYETLNFIKKLKNCDQMYISVATPYPGTELYQQAVNGEGGLVLLEKDFSKYKRYGSPVIKVNDLGPEELNSLQRKGYIMFYFTPRRIWYNFRRAGFLAFIKNAVAFSRSVIFNKQRFKGKIAKVNSYKG